MTAAESLPIATTADPARPPWTDLARIEIRRYVARPAFLVGLALTYAALLPYLESVFAEASEVGAPVLRPLAWDFPADDVAGGLGDEALEYPGVDPFVESASQRGLRSFAESPGDVPRTARDEPMEDRFEAVAVVAAGTVTTQGVRIDGTFRKPGFDRSPEGIDGTRVQRDHDGVTSAGRSRVGWHPTSKSGQPNDWRMVASTPTYWRALLGPATG